jgi:urease accessory protein
VHDAQPLPLLQRTTGSGRLRFGAEGGHTRLAGLYQQGAMRLRPVRGHAQGGAREVVAINTAGGLTGGDRLDLAVVLDAGAEAVVTTPACEKVYRSAGGEAAIATTLALGAGARLDWLPQPMLLFDGSATRRSLTVEMATDARLLAAEAVILGRTAMGEAVTRGRLHDGWRVKRGGRLLFADTLVFAGDAAAALATGATLAGRRAFGTLLYVAPDAEARLEAARNLLEAGRSEWGASAWSGMLVVRFAAADGQMLIDDVAAFLAAFRTAPLPRSWLC